MKRGFCVLLAMTMVFCLFPMSVTAASDVWSGEVATSFASGTGIELDPYIIMTPEQLAYFRDQVNGGDNFAGKHIRVEADLVLNDTTNWELWDNTTKPTNEWEPIGTSESRFSGFFNGDNHTISGVYFNDLGYYVGLFGYTMSASIIENLGVIDSYIKGAYYAGAIAGLSDGAISNCYNTGKVIGGETAGGICGKAFSAIVSYCWNAGTITGRDYAGGITGSTEIGTSLVLGRIFDFCYNKGMVTATGETGSAGGIVGYSDAVWISNCYNEGSISAQMEAGYAGGLAGNLVGNISGIIEYSYNVGSVSGTANRTGLIAGQAYDNTTFTNTYYLDDETTLRAIGQYTDSTVSPETYEQNIDSTGTTPLTADQMRDEANYTGLDFTNTWGWAQEGDKFYPYAYPILRPEVAPPTPINLALTTLGGAARFDKTAIRFGSNLSFEAIVTNANVGDVIDYGFNINGIADGNLTSENWIKLSAARTLEGSTGLIWTEEMAAAKTAGELTEIIRAAGLKVYSYDDTSVSFAIIINNLPAEAQNSLWVFEPYLSVFGQEISLGVAKYNSVNRILDGIASGTYTA